MDRESVPSYPI